MSQNFRHVYLLDAFTASQNETRMLFPSTRATCAKMPFNKQNPFYGLCCYSSFSRFPSQSFLHHVQGGKGVENDNALEDRR